MSRGRRGWEGKAKGKGVCVCVCVYKLHQSAVGWQEADPVPGIHSCQALYVMVWCDSSGGASNVLGSSPNGGATAAVGIAAKCLLPCVVAAFQANQAGVASLFQSLQSIN